MTLSEIEELREHFPILKKKVYLSSNSMGAMPLEAYAAQEGFLKSWEEKGVDAWGDWFAIRDRVREKVGLFIGASAKDIQLGVNVSYFQAMVASCFDYQKRSRVIDGALNFPTVHYVWKSYEALGAEFVSVPGIALPENPPDGPKSIVPTESILQEIDERTLMVTIPHAYYVSGAMVDVKKIQEKAREVGALVLVDAYQTVGAAPIDVTEWDVDMLVGGSHKWLCGGPGCAFLYVRPELQKKLEPRMTGWWSHDKPFAFEPAPIRFAEDMERFMAGTPAPAAYAVAETAYDHLLKFGLKKIREYGKECTQWIIEEALRLGYTINTPRDAEQRSNWVAVDCDGSDKLARTLAKDDIIVDHRPECGIRVGPHFYNTHHDIEAFLNALSSYKN